MPGPVATIEQTIPLPPVNPAGDSGAPVTIHVEADPRRETIVGGGLPWYAARVRALPPWVDPVARDYPGAYAAMLTDAQVSSTLDLRRMATLAQPWNLTVPPGTESDPLAEEIRAFCAGCYTRLRTPLSRVLFELMSALAFGYAVAEQIYDYDADGRLALVDLKPKACEDVILYVDAFGNEVGYRPRMIGMLTLGVDDPTSLYDRRKIVVHKHAPTAHRLLGTSALRPAWEDYWFKKQLDPEYLKYVVQFASPSLHGKVGKEAKPYQERDPLTGKPVPGGKLVYPADVLSAALAKIHNSSWIVTTDDAAIEPIHVTSDGNVFLLAYNAKDRAITKAVLYQTLATEEAEHMARAASDTHQDVLDLVFSWDKEGLETTMRRESLYPLVLYNWGQAAADAYTPVFNLPRVAHQDINELRKGIAALESSGFLHRSQYPGLDQQADLPTRDQAQADADYERGLAAQAAAQASADKQAASATGKQVKDQTQNEGSAA